MRGLTLRALCLLAAASLVIGRHEDQGAQAVWTQGGMGLEQLAVTSAPMDPALPWNCPGYMEQRWYFQGAAGGDLKELGLWSAVMTLGTEQKRPQPHERMCSWLQLHLEQRNATAAARKAKLAAQARGLEGAAAVAAALAPDPGSSRQSLMWPAQREFLVMAPMGPTFDASKWLDNPSAATWDLVGFYYGSDEEFSCKLCKKVYAGEGSKWQLTHALLSHPDWDQLAKQYKAIMVVDENVGLSTAVVNGAFAVQQQYGLLLAQPSVCQGAFATDELLEQHPEYILRYTTFVQMLAPIFDMDFFNNVVGPSLYNAFSGWGLDYVWPFLLRYPEDEVGVVDAVCISRMDWRPWKRRARPAVKHNAVKPPYGAPEEELRRFAEYGYYASEVERLTGEELYTDALPYPNRLATVLGAVTNPTYQPPVFALPARGVAGCMLAFMAVVAAIAWRRRRQHHTLLLPPFPSLLHKV